MTERQVADAAVKRGIEWLDKNIKGWREKIHVDSLNLKYPCECVLGQLDGDFFESVWNRHMERDEVIEMGFSAGTGMHFSVLTAAWKRALKAEAA